MKTCPCCGREHRRCGRMCGNCESKWTAVRVITRMRLRPAAPRPVQMVCTRGGCEWLDGRVCSRECKYAVPRPAGRSKGVRRDDEKRIVPAGLAEKRDRQG